MLTVVFSLCWVLFIKLTVYDQATILLRAK